MCLSREPRRRLGRPGGMRAARGEGERALRAEVRATAGLAC